MRITQDDLLDALREALTVPVGEGTTVQEMAAATGQNEKAVRRFLKALQVEGRLEVVAVRRPALDGRMRQVPGYRIRPKGKKSA